jgi:hypothetical protein
LRYSIAISEDPHVDVSGVQAFATKGQLAAARTGAYDIAKFPIAGIDQPHRLLGAKNRLRAVPISFKALMSDRLSNNKLGAYHRSLHEQKSGHRLYLR